MKILGTLFLSSLILVLGACGGGNSSPNVITPLVSGNWQFTISTPTDNSYAGGLQGGFLVQDKEGALTGSIVYSVSLPQPPPTPPRVCNSGTAAISGTLKGQAVSFTALAGTQTFTFTGTLSSDNKSMGGTYASTDGTAADGSPCGTEQNGLQWSAAFVPPLTGPFQGILHSTNGANGLQNIAFPVFGTLEQGDNQGAGSATITGTLTALSSQIGSYPCFDTATLTGQISGNTLVLNIFTSNGLDAGQIGGLSPNQPVTVSGTQAGYVIRDFLGGGYALNTKTCPGASLANPGDSGNVCLSVGSTNACTQPLTLSPAFVTFSPQLVGTSPAQQTITLSNSDPSNATLSGLSLSFLTNSGSFGFESDFNGLSNFTEQDDCSSFPGASFDLLPMQSCSITVKFSPQQSCPWLPSGTPPFGAPPAKCPVPMTATLVVNSPKSADNNKAFAVKITGTGLSAIAPSVPELDFGSQALGGSSVPQLLTFTNQSLKTIQILPAASTPCKNSDLVNLPHPLTNDGSVDGIRVARTDAFASIQPNPPSITYFCDADSVSGLPNFQISSNTCLGRQLASQDTCSMQVTFVPQPGTDLAGPQGTGLDYFLELNTLQCDGSVSDACEIDSGRFPVELRSNPPSPLRMSPGAGLDFGTQKVGTTSSLLNVSLFNDPTDPHSSAVNITGIGVKGDYVETDDCPGALAPGAGCSVSVSFKPKAVGVDPGTVTITYNGGQTQIIYLRGSGE